MIGRVISHYKIIEKIGGGGMGIVYKAQDFKLDRFVALKFLPPELTRDPEAKQRFIREAQAASSLDHPNICTIHEINETEDGRMFIVMACYEGETLKDKIIAAGDPLRRKDQKLKTEDAIDIAIQIAQGLARAHDEGIVHRDIKPANIIITDRGEIKILDFGLAKLAGQAQLTKDTSTLGTVAYMAPEQLQGRELDARSDIFSFGVLLYEMLSGVLPFKGDYEPAIMYAILNEEPEPIQKHQSELSSEFLHVLNRALEKYPEDRYQSVKDMLIDLRRLKRDSSKVSQKSLEMMKKNAQLEKPPSEIKQKESANRWKTLFVYSAIAVVILSGLIITIYYLINKKATYVPASHKQITFTGGAYNPEISPDGNFIAYISKSNHGSQAVMVQDLAGGQPLRVFEDKNISRCLWTPNGSELSIIARNDSSYNHCLIPRLGGDVRRFKYLFTHCFSPDGSVYAGSFITFKRICFVNKQTGDTSSIALNGPFTWFRDIDWSTTDEYLLFLTSYQKRNTIWTIKANGSKQQRVLEDSLEILSPHWSNQGDAIYYLRSRGQLKDLMKIKIDPSHGIAEDKPEILQSGIPMGSVISLSKDNKKLLYTREILYSNLKLIRQQNGKQTINSLTKGTQQVFSTSISPDGKKVVFSMGNRENANIFVMPVEGGEKKQLTFFNSFNDFPAWSPDGKKIAFGSNEGGQFKVWIIEAAGGTPRPFKNSELSNSEWVVRAPGKEILYQRPGNRNYHFLDPQTEKEKPLVPNDSVGWIFNPQYSPDNKNIAVSWNRRKKSKRMPGTWLISLIDASQKYLYPERSWPVGWSSDSKWIYVKDYERTGEIVRIRVSDGKVEPFVTLPFEKIDSITMTEDGKKIICSAIDKKSDVWIMENFDPGVE